MEPFVVENLTSKNIILIFENDFQIKYEINPKLPLIEDKLPGEYFVSVFYKNEKNTKKKYKIILPASLNIISLDNIISQSFDCEAKLEEIIDKETLVKKEYENNKTIIKKFFPYYKKYKVSDYVMYHNDKSKLYQILNIKEKENEKIEFEIILNGLEAKKENIITVDPENTKLTKFANLNVVIIHKDDTSIYEKFIPIDINIAPEEIYDILTENYFTYLNTTNIKLLFKDKDILPNKKINSSFLRPIKAIKESEQESIFPVYSNLISLNFNFTKDHLTVLVPNVINYSIFSFRDGYSITSSYKKNEKLTNVLVFSENIIMKNMLICGINKGIFDSLGLTISEFDNNPSNYLKEDCFQLNENIIDSNRLNTSYFWNDKKKIFVKENFIVNIEEKKKDSMSELEKTVNLSFEIVNSEMIFWKNKTYGFTLSIGKNSDYLDLYHLSGTESILFQSKDPKQSRPLKVSAVSDRDRDSKRFYILYGFEYSILE